MMLASVIPNPLRSSSKTNPIELISRYDRAHTFFYLDPPYFGFKVHHHNFEQPDFERMAEILA
jgi:site-specific DNA-adenine methylase